MHGAHLLLERMHWIYDALIPAVASFAQDVHVKLN
jgi:hypothetical protein